MIFSHLSCQSCLQVGDVSNGMGRTMVVFSDVPLSQPSTDDIFANTELFTREIDGNWLPYDSHFDTKQPLVFHLLLRFGAPHVSPATLIDV